MASGEVVRLFGDHAAKVREPGGKDHYISVDGKCEAVLLGSWYPTEIAQEKQRMAFKRANPGSRVELRSDGKPAREKSGYE